MNVVVLIPAYNPDEKLVKLLTELSQQDFRAIVIVNDASKQECSSVFDAASKFENTIILTHDVNKGQGGSLKTGLAYISQQFSDVVGSIHCDADGQHSVNDIIRTAQELEKHPKDLILGVRGFSGDVPFRSKFGNKMTCVIMKLLFGLNVSDTQTGMRGVPAYFFPRLISIPYNRFEYNTEMLLVSRIAGLQVREIPIETIYIDNNASSHFNPLLDSVKIYFALFRYMIVSVLTAITDYTVFILSYRFIESILYTNYLARLFALIVQYLLVKKFVFISNDRAAKTFPKYVLLVITSGFISTSIITYLITTFKVNIVLSKLIAEALLYSANFIIQKELIFVNKKEY